MTVLRQGSEIAASPRSYPVTNAWGDVYALAAKLARGFDCTHILDLGCANSPWPIPLAPEFQVMGAGSGPSFDACLHRHPAGRWLRLDLGVPHERLLEPEILRRTLIICSGLRCFATDPRGILATLSDCLRYAPAALITAALRKPQQGLMTSDAAAQEETAWTLEDFRELLDKHGLDLAFLGLARRLSPGTEKDSILSIVHGAPLARPRSADSEDFRVIAIMTVYNEEDIVVWSLRHLIASGIDVYLIDNGSTDNTVAAASPLLGHGLLAIERFPPAGISHTFDLHELLRRVEELAKTLEADWFIHHDCDELRESPWPAWRLKDAIRYADRLGYNAIDHTVVDFFPIDDNFVPGTDYSCYFTKGAFGRRPAHFLQIKAWKKTAAPVSLAASGGHSAEFAGRKVFPYKFLLRHYPVRSQQHGERKIFVERLRRFNPDEREHKGWHHQYDHLREDHQFLRNPATLEITFDAGFYSHFLVERISGIGLTGAPSGQPDPIPIDTPLRVAWTRLIVVIKRAASFLRPST